MKKLMMMAAGLLLSGLLLAPAMGAGNGAPVQEGAGASSGVSKIQQDLIKKRQAARSRVEEMQLLRARTIAEEREADEEAKKSK